ncbi:MAG: glycosyltransferase family 4 protein [Candidatus Omnitrophica bacterium]|nr:glycosyltransferase family 4 protein [Candidatus Omnitrophota bacterium]
MKALFVHSTRFVRTPDGKVFTGGSLSYEHLKRYLKYFDALTVIGRLSECSTPPENWSLSSGPGVNFAGTPDDHGKPLMQLQTGASRKLIQQQIEDCDAVIVRQSPIGWMAAKEAHSQGVPWAVEVVASAWDDFWHYGTLPGKLYAPLAWWESRRWTGQAKFAIYVTRQYLQKRYPCPGLCAHASNVQIRPVPNAVLEERLAGWSAKQSNCSKTPVIGMIGSLFTRHKGLHVALKALCRLKQQGLLIHLRVLGSGKLDSWQAAARQLGAGGLLHLDGSLPAGEPVMQWLDALDIYIQPSITEGLPRALIEAMSRGLPALGSTCAGIPELLPYECLHHPGDDKTLAAQLRRMVEDKSWQIQQAKRNFEKAQEYYSDHVNAQRDQFWHRFVEHVKAANK